MAPLSLSEIKALESVDLENFEIRGAKYGINNSRTTGTLYVDGIYEPGRNILLGDSSFDSDSSIITGISIDSPYSGFDASVFKFGDILRADSTSFTVQSVVNTNSLELDSETGLEGSFNFDSTLGSRDYLIESDVFSNTTGGYATFTQDSSVVTSDGLSNWLTGVTSGDYIKAASYQKFYIVDQVDGTNQLTTTEKFAGDSTYTEYVHKLRQIDRMFYRYTKDDFRYEKNGGFWVQTDSTTDGGLLSTTASNEMADGIDLRFTHTVNPSEPDMMEVAPVLNKVLAQETENDLYQFDLRAIPFPEDTLEVKINNVVIDRFPYGNQDYAVSYSQDPIYVKPPQPEERRVANLMFLKNVGPITLNPLDTIFGTVNFVNEDGNNVAGTMPGAELILMDGTAQVLNEGYVLDAEGGFALMSSPLLSEPLVKYVAHDVSDLLDFGVSVSLNGSPLQLSFPPKSSDEVRVILENGVVKPADKDHPGVGEEYLVRYQVEASSVTNEVINPINGQTIVRTALYPIMRDSVIIIKRGDLVEEGLDYFINYQNGRISFSTPLTVSDGLQVSYTPLSKQLNGISYSNNKDLVTVYDARMIVRDSSAFNLSLINFSLDTSKLTVLRIYNDSRNKEYDLTGLSKYSQTIILQDNAFNNAIGISSNDIIVIDYIMAKSSLEYFPVVPNKIVMEEDSNGFTITGRDSTSTFQSGSVIGMVPSNSSKNFSFVVQSSEFDGEDTNVRFEGRSTEDIPNPYMTATDSSVSFNTIPYEANPIVSGQTFVTYSDMTDPTIFRTGSVLKISGDAFKIVSAEYDTDGNKTTVTLSSGAPKDYDDVTTLSTIKISDVPIYNEGDILITASQPIISTIPEPGFVFNSSDPFETYYVSTDSSNLSVVTDSSSYMFPYVDYPTLGDMSSAMDTASIPNLSVAVFASDGRSSINLTRTSSLPIWLDSSSIVNLNVALRLDGSDTTNFEVVNGSLQLNRPLEIGQRYEADYLGLDYLAESSISFSTKYFTILPAGSKITVSMQFINLDQFYVEVLSQREFLERVLEPRNEEESRSLSGSVGQGGDIIGDEASGNAAGGLTNDEYIRQDLEIETHVYKSIWDYFNDRLIAYGEEMYSSVGLQICNNDGLLDSTDETIIARKSFSRLWPTADYTNFEPFESTPITGNVYGPGTAIFTNGTTDVTSFSAEQGDPTNWTDQLRSGDYIGPLDSTKQYQISLINSDHSITLTPNFDGVSTTGSGESFVASSNYPLSDDDGFVGGKLEGVQSGSPSLRDGDIFDCYLDGVYKSYEFIDPVGPFLSNFFSVSSLTLSDAARQITTNISGVVATVESIYDLNSTYGTRSSIVLRTDSTVNCIEMSDGSAVYKLGFTHDGTACGNIDQTSSGSEVIWDAIEKDCIDDELGYLSTSISLGTTNKLDRTSAPGIVALDGILSSVECEVNAIENELIKLGDQTDALKVILGEPTSAGYAKALEAYNDATTYITEALSAQVYGQSIANDWEGQSDATRWVLNIQDHQQYVRGKGFDNVGVPVASGVDTTNIIGQTSFILEHTPSIFDIRFLDSTTYSTPTPRYEDNNAIVPGIFNGWEMSSPIDGSYSVNNQLDFTMSSIEAFYMVLDGVTDQTDTRYSIDTSAMAVRWEQGVTTQVQEFPYSTYLTMGSMKTALNSMTGLNVTGSVSLDASSSILQIIGETPIAPDSSTFQALRPLYVDYPTISEQSLSDRTSFISDRYALITGRIFYLEYDRFNDIRNSIRDEEILRSLDGGYGNLYLWSDNRFNRTQGCDARLFQQEQIMARNQSALQVTQRLV